MISIEVKDEISGIEAGLAEFSKLTLSDAAKEGVSPDEEVFGKGISQVLGLQLNSLSRSYREFLKQRKESLDKRNRTRGLTSFVDESRQMANRRPVINEYEDEEAMQEQGLMARH